MVWSFLAGRLTVRPTTLTVVARRTLSVTPQLNFPPPKASESTAKKADRETAEDKTSKTPAKRGRPPKNPAEPRQKKPAEQEKQRVRVPENLKPPKRAPGPYFLFYSSFLQSQAGSSSLQGFQELSKRAGEVWRGYSMAEKQPFYDENEVRKEQAKQERDEFFRNTSLTDLKRLNAIRKAQGKTKFHSTKKRLIPATPFIQFSNEFRNSLEGQDIINEAYPEKKFTVRAVLAAADRWRSMSEEEKAPYFERYRKAKEELTAEHVQS